jgi:hypothetical protein
MHPVRDGRPTVADPRVRSVHWAVSSIMLAATLLASGWKGRWYAGKVDAAMAEVCSICALIPLMCVASPVFHRFYTAMALPLVMILLVMLWERSSDSRLPSRWKALFWFIAASNGLVCLDAYPFPYLLDFGLLLFSTLMLWAATLAVVRQTAHH